MNQPENLSTNESLYQLDKPDNVVEMLENSIEKFPENPFLGMKNKEGIYEYIQYKDFGQRVDNARSGLSQLDVKKDDGIGIISNNSTDWAVVFFAVCGLEAHFVPMYEAELVQVWEYIIRDSGLKILFVSKKEIYEKIKDFTEKIPTLEKIILIDGSGDDTLANLENSGSQKNVPSIKPDQSNIGILIYTSGTTGDPKGVLLSQGNLTSNSHGRVKKFHTFDENERTLSILPWAHVFGLGEMITFMQIGASSALSEKVEMIGEELLQVKPTFLIAVPRIFNKVYDGLWTRMNDEGGLAKALFVMGYNSSRKRRELAKRGKSSGWVNFKFNLADKIVFSKIREKLGGRLKGSMTGSAAMNVDISEFFWDIGVPLYDVYGLSETTPAATMNCPDKWRIGSVGAAIDKCKIVIDSSVVEDEAIDGEIVIYGANVMQGYHNKEKATADVMTEDGGFRTGDRGRLDDDGFLFITGRIKEQFKLENGKYVFPASMEEDIKLNHYVENAMIYGDGRRFCCCIVIPDFLALDKWIKKNNMPEDHEEIIKNEEFKTFIENEIMNQLQGVYGNYEIPKKFIFFHEPFSSENGTLTQTMKLKRRVVLDRFKDEIDAIYSE